jgi:hypothetical protein
VFIDIWKSISRDFWLFFFWCVASFFFLCHIIYNSKNSYHHMNGKFDTFAEWRNADYWKLSLLTVFLFSIKIFDIFYFVCIIYYM